MKKMSDKVASKVAKVTLGLGLTAAIICPFAGAALAAWSTGAAAIASFGLGAGIPLAGAGGFGGFILGSIAAPFVAVGSVIASVVTGAATKAVGSLVEWMAAGGKSETPVAPPSQTTTMQHINIDPKGMAFYSQKLGAAFAAKSEPKAANENKPQPKLQKLLRFGR